jgi:hypothetical protein
MLARIVKSGSAANFGVAENRNSMMQVMQQGSSPGASVPPESALASE